MGTPRAIGIVKNAAGPFADEVVLDYEERHRRRALFRSVAGAEFLLDLADVPDLRDGDAVMLSSGELVRVRAAEEALMEIVCADPRQLARIAWHIGNRHLAAEIVADGLRLRADHVIAAMVAGLGGAVRYLNAPFNAEGGAYEERSIVPRAQTHHHVSHE